MMLLFIFRCISALKKHTSIGYMHHKRGKHLILKMYYHIEPRVFLHANLHGGCALVQNVYVECSSMYPMYVLSKYIIAYYLCYNVCFSMTIKIYTIALVYIDAFSVYLCLLCTHIASVSCMPVCPEHVIDDFACL